MDHLDDGSCYINTLFSQCPATGSSQYIKTECSSDPISFDYLESQGKTFHVYSEFNQIFDHEGDIGQMIVYAEFEDGYVMDGKLKGTKIYFLLFF